MPRAFTLLEVLRSVLFWTLVPPRLISIEFVADLLLCQFFLYTLMISWSYSRNPALLLTETVQGKQRKQDTRFATMAVSTFIVAFIGFVTDFGDRLHGASNPIPEFSSDFFGSWGRFIAPIVALFCRLPALRLGRMEDDTVRPSN